MEYWADVKLTNKLEEWLLLQGATVYPSNRLPEYRGSKEVPADPVVFFGGRQIYFYHGSGRGERKVRIFFNDANENTRTLMMLLFSDAIEDHNFKDMKQIF